MTDNAGYRPTNDSAPRWEDNYCDKCNHHDRYHFKNGEGKVFCRWDNLCVCAECPPAVTTDSISGEQT